MNENKLTVPADLKKDRLSGEVSQCHLNEYLAGILETIDDDNLRAFFVSQLGVMGMTPEIVSRHYIAARDVKLISDGSDGKQAYANTREVGFYPANVLRDVQNITDSYFRYKLGQGIENEEYQRVHFDFAKIVALHIFVHEQLHRLSSQDKFLKVDSATGPESQDRLTEKYAFKIGIEIQNLEKQIDYDRETKSYRKSCGDVSLSFRGINEGLTELLAQQLTIEYQRQHQVIDAADTSEYFFSHIQESGSYHRERWITEQLVVIFSSLLDVPEDVILKSFFQEYIKNGEIIPAGFIEVMQHEFPDAPPDEILMFIGQLKNALSDQSFTKNSNLYSLLISLIEVLPQAKKNHCKDSLAKLYLKYNKSQPLDDGISEVS